MNIKILGNGGFYNEGLPYNAMAIDGHVLVETPPDILQSLMQQGMSPAQVDTVFISHIHGDHCFGFPFFFFNWLYWGEADSHYNRGTRLVVIGPQGIAGHLRELMRLAIPTEHPYLRDFDQRVQIVEIEEDDVIAVKGNLWFGFRRTAHSLPTFSLIAGEGEQDGALPSSSEYLKKALFIYSSDTSMFEGIRVLLDSGAKLILCDTNGEKENGVHMSPQELMATAQGLSDADGARLRDFESGRIRGIHMSKKMERAGELLFVQPGEEFSVR
ncbi:MAG: MBL fold metallo-hydrolase [Rectinema sp.]